jgi:hypothetical protein
MQPRTNTEEMAVPSVAIAINHATADFTQNDGTLQPSANFSAPGWQRIGRT